MSNKFSSNKEVKKLVKKAIEQGWRVERSSNSHILFYPPNVDDGFVTVSHTPSSYRNFKNSISLLKAKGLSL